MTGRTLLRATRLLGAVLLLAGAPPALAQKARIGNLSDVAFGAISNLSTDAVQAQSVCAYTQSATGRYMVTATGSGAGGAFELTSGTAPLAYEVEWAASAGQSSGAALAPGVPLTGVSSAASQQTCNSGPPASASLVVVLRAAALGSAGAGSYSGTLSVLIAPE